MDVPRQAIRNGGLVMGAVLGLWLFVASMGGEAPPPPVIETFPCSSADLELGRVPADALRETTDDGTQVYATSIGPLALPRAFVEHADARAVRALGQAVAHAETSVDRLDRSGPPWTWIPLGPLGGFLEHPGGACLVGEDSVLLPETVAPREAADDQASVAKAADELAAAVAGSSLIAGWTSASLADLLGRLAEPAGDPTRVDLDPAFARRIVAGRGWLEAVVPTVPAPTRKALARALERAALLRPTACFTGDALRVTRIADAWADRGFLLDVGTATFYVRRHPRPLTHTGRWELLQTCRLLYELPRGANLLAAPDVVARAPSAMLLHQGRALSTWDERTGFGANSDRWFDLFHGEGMYGVWMPHLPLVGPDDTLHGVAVIMGIVRPPSIDSESQRERFLVQAARCMPDAFHLDLLQQYFMRYVRDSPDVSLPLLVGCRDHSADIHQTVAQVLATCSGGVCRGDCDDFAELVQEIAVRQGHLAHVVSLPGHLATAWADRNEEKGEWEVHVLQTGPVVEESDPDLAVAWRKAMARLAPDEPFDRHRVDISLRFDGENTRATYSLPTRILRDPEYARTMVALQEDWHHQRYLRIREAMEAVVAAGDDTPGNLEELASAYARIGLDARAAALEKRILATREEPESRALATINWIGALAADERDAEVEAAVEALLAEDLPTLVKALDHRAIGLLRRLAEALVDEERWALGLRVLEAGIACRVPSLEASLAALLDPAATPASWREHREAEALQDLATDYAWSLSRAWLGAREAGLPGPSARLRGAIDVWLRRFALDDREERDGLDSRWLLRTEMLIAADPTFRGRVLAAPAPTEAGPAWRRPELSYEEAALAWARSSVRYFAYALLELVGEDAGEPDPAHVERLRTLMAEAARTRRRLKLQGSLGMGLLQRGRLAAAVLLREPRELEDVLREIRLEGDRGQLGRAAWVVGASASQADAAWWGETRRCWFAAMPDTRYTFRIAWQAFHAGAGEQALAMVEAAAARAPQDAALQHEARLFRAFVQPEAAAAGSPDAPR